MTDTPSKARQQAEVAFAKARSQFLAKDDVTLNCDAVTRAREEKTVRLRKARLAKENADAAKNAVADRIPKA